MVNQPGDMSFVITSMLSVSATPGGLLSGTINPAAVGVSGQSDGAITAGAVGYNTCCLDPRVKAGALLSGAAVNYGEWFPPGTPPLLVAHATADEVNPYGASEYMFIAAQSPKYFLTIHGGSHLETFTAQPEEPQVVRVLIDFFDLYLTNDPSAAVRLEADGNQPGALVLETG